jgi:hypothetical protein
MKVFLFEADSKKVDLFGACKLLPSNCYLGVARRYFKFRLVRFAVKLLFGGLSEHGKVSKDASYFEEH